MPEQRINGWTIRASKAHGHQDGYHLQGECVTWDCFTRQHERLRNPSKPARTETEVAVIYFREMGQMPHLQDLGLLITGHCQGRPDQMRFILPPVDQPPTPHANIRTLTQAVPIHTALYTSAGQRGGVIFPLEFWDLQLDENRANAQTIDILITVVHESFASYAKKLAVQKGVTTIYDPGLDQMDEMLKTHPSVDHQPGVFTLAVTAAGQPAAMTCVTEEQARAKSIRAFTELYRPADLVKSASLQTPR